MTLNTCLNGKIHKGGEIMSKICPVCKVKKPGLCIHEKIMLGMMVVGIAVVLVLVF